MIQEVTKIYVKQLNKTEAINTHAKKYKYTWENLEAYLSIFLNHDVTVVSVTDAQNKSGYAITSTGSSEQVNGQVIPTVM